MDFTINRRTFLQRSGLVAGSMLVPQFIQQLDARSLAQRTGRSLIIVQWSGGNDGLNTIVPYGDDRYYQQRPRLGLSANAVLPLTDFMGLHPSLTALRDLYHAGDVAIINNVGYPSPDRSHFRSMDIWQTASAPDEYLQTGWLGRYLDVHPQQAAHAVLELDDTLSLALRGSHGAGLATRNIAQLRRATQHPVLSRLLHEEEHAAQVGYLYKTLADTRNSADYLLAHTQGMRVGEYPKDEFGRSLAAIGALITNAADTQVYYTDMAGFDTHVQQLHRQKRLLDSYNAGIAALVQQLKAAGKWEHTLVLTFSEFGRRVAENASGGTDHGAANAVWLMGGALKASGLLTPAPDLGDLDAGDLKHTVDFRSVYATLLTRWLEADAPKILGGDFPLLPFV